MATPGPQLRQRLRGRAAPRGGHRPARGPAPGIGGREGCARWRSAAGGSSAYPAAASGDRADVPGRQDTVTLCRRGAHRRPRHPGPGLHRQQGGPSVFLTPLEASPDPLRELLCSASLGNRYINSVGTPLTLDPCGAQPGRLPSSQRRPPGHPTSRDRGERTSRFQRMCTRATLSL